MCWPVRAGRTPSCFFASPTHVRTRDRWRALAWCPCPPGVFSVAAPTSLHRVPEEAIGGHMWGSNFISLSQVVFLSIPPRVLDFKSMLAGRIWQDATRFPKSRCLVLGTWKLICSYLQGARTVPFRWPGTTSGQIRCRCLLYCTVLCLVPWPCSWKQVVRLVLRGYAVPPLIASVLGYCKVTSTRIQATTQLFSR